MLTNVFALLLSIKSFNAACGNSNHNTVHHKHTQQQTQKAAAATLNDNVNDNVQKQCVVMYGFGA
jgi:hypothetical protein